MKERPILLNAEMVRAVLDGRKTQTRRIIQSPAKNMQARGHECISYRAPGDKWYQDYVFSMRDRSGTWQDYKHEQFLAKCPFGAVGDRLWVRETWTDVNLEGFPAVAYRADNDVYSPMDDKSFLDEDGSFNYDDPRVSKYHFAAWYGDVISGTEGNWRPSIHMPRWASRITLEITGVRVELLNSINEDDAIAEGIDMEALFDSQDCYDCIADHNMTGRPTATGAFKYLWESIYGEESWQANPWVWVIEFKKLEANHDN